MCLQALFGDASYGAMAAKKKQSKKREPTVMVSVRFPVPLAARLDVASRHHNITVQELVRKGVQMALGDL